ncbi:MAG: preprotein translocase subunit SecE [Ferrovum sp. 37-45-19]|jgi:preprotein translocase subunit SecE|uniref:preprotein translocase subunit SecE n=1 Tax=Ferrovum sp. JA12 TaxID=1356299 RepID=UPI0007023F2A|nr:preprotein translocase subunit SecE [Ferrovum sp. JA12]OYV78736.1 MAG: preprotein translocase subunit SecE [Ferrovum sp. 21-44-67]OYV93403.1 MAG: preprotein translocase subunit SecE [Ferrovum sp. 37-45-19]OZB32483.1 MAG: preprotein translocase subunit SecE [Ferrovum sp. 34-44-207]HQT81744.1 preprotein translocase subunit SecE [Ferrovaceae bacterium]KRH79572.1 protein translocase subunit SecE [Ferrovum sp. JA12]
MADKLKFAFALVLVAAGLIGYYQLSEHALLFRVLSVLVGLGLGVLVAWFTASGQEFFRFSQDAVAETKRVVWPSKKETYQTTLVVFALVLVMGLFLWLVDWGLLALVQRLLGRTE